MKLRELDDAALPVAARHLDSWVATARARVWRVVDALAALRATPRVRVVRRPGPLGSAVAAVIVVLTLAGIGAAAFLAGSPRHRAATLPTATVVGPHAGQKVAAYRAVAARDVTRATRSGGSVFAIVDLTRYLTARQAARAFGRYHVVRVFFQTPAHARLENAHSATVGSLDDLPRAMQAVAVERRQEAQTINSYLAHAHLSGANGQRLRDYYLSQARAASAEARALAGECACVFGLVVHETPARIRRLAGASGVRVVDAAPHGAAFSQVLFVPLPPEARDVVPVVPPVLPVPGFG